MFKYVALHFISLITKLVDRRPWLKNQEWGGLETPIHNWSLWPSLQLLI